MASRFEKHIDINGIPTLPAIAMEAIRLMEGDQSSFSSIADLLKNDQVLSGRILHYANSAYVGSRSEVTTIGKAVSLLGFTTVRCLILSASVFDCFSGPLASRRHDLVQFWLHSIGVAVCAELLAVRLGFAKPDEAYLAGLVHDIGKLVCFLHLPEDFAKICQELDRQGDYGIEAPLALEVEEGIMGTTHVEVGKRVASQWLFPAALTKAMWLHHQPVFATITPDPANLHQLIRFADVLCVSHNIGSSYFLGTRAYDHQHYHFALENLLLRHHLSSDDIAAIIEQVTARVKDLAAILGLHDADAYHHLVGSANQSLGSVGVGLDMRNRDLAQANRVLDATCLMVRRLKSGMAPEEAVGEILTSARQAFGIHRCLCMVVDDKRDAFIGKIATDQGMEGFEVARRGGAVMGVLSSGNADIEAEAVRRLQRASLDFAQGGSLESGMAAMIAGSELMASFFVADKTASGRPERIIGQLLLDFAGTERGGGLVDAVNRNFQIFATSAASAVERILLESDLESQAREIADTARKMEESQRQLFHSHRLATVGRLAAGAAHEINNPLTIISLNLQIMDRLLANGGDVQEIRERLKVVFGQEQRISKIIGELMGFARPTQPKLEPTNLAKVMADLLMVIGDRVSMTKVTVDNQIPADLPLAYVDGGQIEQVFMNLLINANQAMPEGGRITLTAEVDRRNRVAVSVSDTGAGIAKDNLTKIFDPFFTTKKEGEGTGLGLAICHSIVEHNGGTLQVQSEEGAGATFTVRLPLDQSSRLQSMKKAVNQQRKETPTGAEICRILVVDDERLLNDMLQECLRSAGYEVDGAYDGIEGIGLLRYKKYHLILLDIRMPRKDGLEVLHFVRTEYPTIPVVIITGLASMQEIRETVRKGAFACIKKPFQLDKVLAKVGEALASGSGCRPSGR